MEIMTKNHRRWREFCNRLACRIVEDMKEDNEPSRRWVLGIMGFADDDIEASLAYLEKHDVKLTARDIKIPTTLFRGNEENLRF